MLLCSLLLILLGVVCSVALHLVCTAFPYGVLRPFAAPSWVLSSASNWIARTFKALHGATERFLEWVPSAALRERGPFEPGRAENDVSTLNCMYWATVGVLLWIAIVLLHDRLFAPPRGYSVVMGTHQVNREWFRADSEKCKK